MKRAHKSALKGVLPPRVGRPRDPPVSHARIHRESGQAALIPNDSFLLTFLSPLHRNNSHNQYQTFFSGLYSDESKTCVSRNIGHSTFSASPHAQLIPTDLDCAISQISSEFSFILPRQGEAYSTCGTVKAIHKTLHDDCTDILYHHCDRPECPCPYCADRLLSRDALKAAERLTEMSRLYYIETGTKLGWPRHVVFSDPRDEGLAFCSSPDGFMDYRTFAIQIMKQAGAVGGMVVPHMYRILGEPDDCDDNLDEPGRCALGGIAEQLKNAGYGIGKKYGSKGSLWDGIFADALGIGPAYCYVYFSPHFHAHLYGHLENSRVFFKRTGWIYKNLGARKSEKALAASIAYTLSHATRLEVLGVPKTKAVSWFGLMAYNKGGVTEIRGHIVPKTCDHGHTYHEVAINDPSLIYEEIWVREICRYYKLNVKMKPPPIPAKPAPRTFPNEGVELPLSILVTFLKAVPAFAGIDGRVHGPFLPGDIGELPEIQAKALISKGAAW